VSEARPRPENAAEIPRSAAGTPGALGVLGRFAVRRRYLVFGVAALGALAAYLFGHDVPGRLAYGGWIAADAESQRADAVLGEVFPAAVPNLVLVARAPDSVDSPQAAAASRRLTAQLAREPGTTGVGSYWTTHDPTLRSRDGRAALIVTRLSGSERYVTTRINQIVPRFTGQRGPLMVTAGGEAPTWREVEDQSAADLRRAELLAIPAALVGLLLIFGGPLAAVLPVIVGTIAVAGTVAVLRILAGVTTASIFALNITTAFGFALALDYSLFLVSRYREELDAGHPVNAAIERSMRTAGRTVLYSAVTVVLSLAGLVVFPLFLFRSLAYAGMCVVGLAAVAALVVLPAALSVLGERITWFDPFRGLRRRWSAGQSNWRRLALAVMRHPVLVAVPVTIVLLVLAVPFRNVSFSLSDDRVLPPSAPAHQAAQVLRNDFGIGTTMYAKVVITGLDPGRAATALDGYARRISTLPSVRNVATATGLYAHGQRLTPLCTPGAPGPASCAALAGRFVGRNAVWLYVNGSAEPHAPVSLAAVRHIRDLPSPAPALVAGPTAEILDAKETIASGLPWAVGVVVLATLVLLFLFTGSVFIPVKAVVVNLFSLTATFGAIVYIFQEGHLRWLVGDFTVTGTTSMVMPVLMFCIAFGLSMDYECLLLSRITEEHTRTGETIQATALGLERTARLFTASAALAAIAMGCLAISRLSLLKLLGVGLMLAIVLDATLIRCLLVPALLRIAGRVNWWAPKPLRRLRAGIGRRHGGNGAA
jgi:putative drug exporter of the RND superfamily